MSWNLKWWNKFLSEGRLLRHISAGNAKIATVLSSSKVLTSEMFLYQMIAAFWEQNVCTKAKIANSNDFMNQELTKIDKEQVKADTN